MTSRGETRVSRHLQAALRQAGVMASRRDDGRVTIDVGDSVIDVTPLERSVLSAGRAADIVRSIEGDPATTVIVSDKIPGPARDALTSAGVGWFDRRGHLRLQSKGLFINTEVGSPDDATQTYAPRFPSGRTGVSVALALLSHADDPPGVTAIAEQADVARSGVSAATKAFRDLGLIRADGRPVNPDLFWAAAEHWNPRWVPLSAPIDSDPDLVRRLGGAFGDLAQPGWCLAGDAAAAAWGAPIVGGDIGPRRWYVPSLDVLDNLRWVLGEPARNDPASDFVAVAPTLVVCADRVHLDQVEHPVESLVATALDLTLDRARGREALDVWDPATGTRVW